MALDQYTLFSGANQWPSPPIVECSFCGSLVANNVTSMNKHIRWHEFIVLVGVTVNHAFTP